MIVFILAYFLLKQEVTSQSISINNVYIKWRNLGTQTEFVITSSLNDKISPDSAWIGLGINSYKTMVHLFFIKNIFITLNLKFFNHF